MITNRLNAAEPTIVDAPSGPMKKLLVMVTSMSESRISGADEPSAISERLATVGFHTRETTRVPSRRTLMRVAEVICSIAAMKASARMATPTKSHISPSPYSTTRNPRGQFCSSSPNIGTK
jgi:hypothetical protein